MTHTHGMDLIRHETEREAAKEVWMAAMALFDQIPQLEAIRTAHIANFPQGPLTCEQLDELDSAIANLKSTKTILDNLSKEVSRKLRKDATK